MRESIGVFFIPAAFSMPASAKNYNLSHVYTVAVNVAKWNGEDRSSCTTYCTRSDPTLSRIHNLIDGIQYPEEMPPTGSDELVRQSIEQWKEYLERNPNDYETWAALGAAYAKVDRYPDALASFQEAISVNPKYAEAYLGLGSTYGFLDRMEDKITACKKAIELKPDYADAYATLGAAYARVGISSDAITAYKTALLLKPKFYYIRYALGTAYLVSGDTEAAFGEARLLELEDASLAKELYELIQRFRAAR
jgi:tetratricopeptide (TPR) repeat protein